MPVLLLAQGDPEAKDMLRRAIEARYGLRPPAIESLQIDFKGRARVKVGPLLAWVPVEASARFLFPTSVRWDFTVKPAGVPVNRGIEAFDGITYRSARGKSPKVVDDAQAVDSIQRRLWALAALFLTPLGDHFVSLAITPDNHLAASNTTSGSTVNLYLRDDNTLDAVDVRCLNPDSDKDQRFSLRLSSDQSMVGELMLPCKVSAYWDDDPFFELDPISADVNPQMPAAVFTLQDESR